MTPDPAIDLGIAIGLILHPLQGAQLRLAPGQLAFELRQSGIGFIALRQ